MPYNPYYIDFIKQNDLNLLLKSISENIYINKINFFFKINQNIESYYIKAIYKKILAKNKYIEYKVSVNKYYSFDVPHCYQPSLSNRIRSVRVDFSNGISVTTRLIINNDCIKVELFKVNIKNKKSSIFFDSLTLNYQLKNYTILFNFQENKISFDKVDSNLYNIKINYNIMFGTTGRGKSEFFHNYFLENYTYIDNNNFALKFFDLLKNKKYESLLAEVNEYTLFNDSNETLDFIVNNYHNIDIPKLNIKQEA